MRKIPVAVFISCITIGVHFSWAQPAGRGRSSLQDAIKAARATSNRGEMMQRYGAIKNYTIQTPNDLQAVYAALIDLEGKISDEEMLQQTAVPTASLIEKATAPALQESVASLLERENRKIPLNYMGFEGISPYHPDKALKEAVRTARLISLLQAVGNGKNRLALSTLRNMQGKGGLPGEIAADALGKIGDTQDLDELIGKIKKNPRARIDLSSFGGVVIDRIMREVDNPNVPESEKEALIPHLGQAGSWRPENLNAQHALIAKYGPLLDHKNPNVVKISARAIAARVKPEDAPVIQKMIGSRDSSVRFQGLRAIDRIWSSRFVPQVLELLKKDPDDNVRAYAATILGQRRVHSAEAAIKQALRDSSGHVRSSASGAIDNLSGESDRRIQEDLKRRKAGQK